MNDKLKIKTSEQKGFTLLLSLLVISIILSVSFGVFDVMTKELKLSGIGRESQISFYAADAGIECAYFWDIKHPGFDDSAFDLDNNNVSSVECGEDDVSDASFEDKDGNGLKETSSFNFNMGDTNNKTEKCAEVTVSKATGDNYDCGGQNCKDITTTIESKGYNYSCGSKSPHKVERGIRVTSTKTEKAK